MEYVYFSETKLFLSVSGTWQFYWKHQLKFPVGLHEHQERKLRKASEGILQSGAQQGSCCFGNDKVTKDTSEDTKKLAEVQSTTDKLKDSADALLATGSQGVFKEDKMTDEDYKAVESFVKDYNSVVSAAGKTDSSSINQRTTNMVYASATNSKLLAKVGITITEDNTLSIDKDSFMKADVSTAKSLFQGNGSYGYRVSAQASMINFAADSEAGKAGTYTANGRYGNNYNTGNLLNLYF